MTQAITWIATGLLVGFVVRTAMKSRRDYGLLGDLVTGALGAVVGGWLVRAFNIVTPQNLAGHIIVSVLGAAVLLAALRALRAAIGAGLSPASPAAVLVTELEDHVRRLTKGEQRLLAVMLGRVKPADPNVAFDQQLTIGQRVADRVAAFGGSWTFIGMFLTGMLAWMAANRGPNAPFDPFPYILLNLVLSCLAAMQAPIIMMSQNRQAARDRADAKSDYEVNLRAEMQIGALHAKLDAAREQELSMLTQLLASQNERLERIELALRSAHD